MIRDLVSALDYSICAEIALAMFVALVPLAKMQAFDTKSDVCESSSLSGIRRAIADPRFRRLLLFGCWFSFFNLAMLSNKRSMTYISL